jgi:hypothetical protein
MDNVEDLVSKLTRVDVTAMRVIGDVWNVE